MGCIMMTLQELADETLVAKNRRLRQERCGHEEVWSSTVRSPTGIYTNKLCLDCGKSWHTELSANKDAV